MTQQLDLEEPAIVVTMHQRAAARTRELGDLLERRPDLAGVYGPADLAAEAVRWCA